jgi:phosphocarrier protein HPr
MLKLSLKLINKLGLHARASAKFVATASRFISKIDVSKDTQTVNGKSIMGVMMLGAKCGTEIHCVIEGPDENELGQALQQLIQNRFDEEE